MKGKTPIFSKALKTLYSARSLIPAGRQNIYVNFTNNALHSDHYLVIKEIARCHSRCSNRSENRMSLGDISNGSISKCKNDSNICRTKSYHSTGSDQDFVSDLCMNKNIPRTHFAYIITRPTTFLKDGRSLKKVSASKSVRKRKDFKFHILSLLNTICSEYYFCIARSKFFSFALSFEQQPGPFPIAHFDLAEFTLNALRNPKLYNSCPYVVADSF